MSKKSILILTLAAVLSALLLAAALVLFPALRKAKHFSDGIDAAFFTRYASGDRPVWFVHGPVSAVTLNGSRTSFDASGRLSPQGDLERVYDAEGRFEGFLIEGSEGKVTCNYDADNLLLSKVEDFDFSRGRYDYVYDAAGNLVQETVGLSEGDSLSLSLTRRYIILVTDAYKNWTLRRTPDGALEERTLSYEEDPEGEKNLEPAVSRLTYTFIRRKNSPRTLFVLAERYLALAATFPENAGANIERAMPLLNQAADASDPDALFLLGRCYASGTGVEKDAERAVALYEEAADAGSIPGAILTADRYFGEKQYARALPFLEKAAAAGDALSSLRIADMYRNGWGVEKDQTEALMSYRTSASDGNLLAMNRLGTCYENGRGCEVDSLSAFRSYQNAAFFGQMNAQYNLAECYRKGIGVPVDRFKARQWYTNAVAAGSASAREALAAMEQEDLDLERIDNPVPADGSEGAPAVNYQEYFNF